MKDSKSFGQDDFELVERQTLWQGFFRMERLRFRHRLFKGGYSAPIERELFVRGNAVGVLLYDPAKGLIGLVEQFRAGALNEPSGPWLWETVAGVIEDGDPEQTARREVEEEAGIRDIRLYPICNYLVSPGGTDEKVFLYCGITDLEGKQGIFGKDGEHEDIRFHVLPEEKVFAALQQDCFNNAMTTIALLWLKLHKSDFCEQTPGNELAT